MIYMEIKNSRNILFRSSLGLQVLLSFLYIYVGVSLYFCFDLRMDTML